MFTDVSQAPVSQAEIDLLSSTTVAEELELIEPDYPHCQIKTWPDAMRLMTVFSGGEFPRSPTAVPGSVTRALRRELATHVAVELNRDALRQETIQDWYAVAYVKGGFAVIRVRVSPKWKPDSEYATPTQADAGLFNTMARATVKRFNQAQLNSGGLPKFWQFVTKPLDYDRVSTEALSEHERVSIRRTEQALAGRLAVTRDRSGELVLDFHPLLGRVLWNSASEGAAGLARHLRLIASRLMKAASQIHPQSVPSLHMSAYGTGRVCRIDGFEDVRLLIDYAISDESAFARAREVLSRIAG